MSKSDLAGTLQRSEIEFHRGLFKIRKVELHHMPKWWMERVCWATRGWGRLDAEKGMQVLERRLPFNLFDHWGSSLDKTGQLIFVTEPYQNSDDLEVWQGVAEIAVMIGIHFRILSAWESWWFPRNTIRIEFSTCCHQTICKKCKGREQARDESRQRKRKRDVVTM